MKRKPLSEGAKIRARYLAANLRGDAMLEPDKVAAAEMVEVADVLTHLGAVSPGTPNEPRALCVLDVASVTGWSRTRAAKWVLGLEAWEAEHGNSWHKRLVAAKTKATLDKLRSEREASIALYANDVSDTQAKRLVRATNRVTIKTMVVARIVPGKEGDALGT